MGMPLKEADGVTLEVTVSLLRLQYPNLEVAWTYMQTMPGRGKNWRRQCGRGVRRRSTSSS